MNVAAASRISAVVAALMVVSGSASEPLPEAKAAVQILAIDAAHTRVDFDITALWVLRRRGEFRELEGTLSIAPDGESAQIDVRIRVASVTMANPDHVALLLSPAFFDAAQHAWIEFRSEPFALSRQASLALPGTLSVRGIRRKVRFAVDTRECRADQLDRCRVRVSGILKRSRFGMTEYHRTLADEVRLRIAASVLGAEAPVDDTDALRSNSPSP